MRKCLLMNEFGHIVNLEQATEFTSSERKGVKYWHVSIGRVHNFNDLVHPFEHAFIEKWVTERLAKEQPRNALGQFSSEAD